MIELNSDKLIVVTGGAGFIGSCVLRRLNQDGMSNIIVVDDLGSAGKWKNLVGKFFVDIISKHKIMGWLKERQSDVEAIIHLGACSNTLEADADYLLENNFHFSVRLAEIALKHDIRFIYASSAATYGDGSRGFYDDHDRLEELRPLNMYGYSKHLFDLWAKRHKVIDDMVGLKYFNVFGPNEYHKGRMASVIVNMVPAARRNGVIKLFKSTSPHFGDGEQCRDFIYVKDVAAMTCSFLKNSLGGIFNIGRGIPGTWNELARAVIESIDEPAHIEYVDMPADLVTQYQNYTCADMGKYYRAQSIENVDLKTATTDLSAAVEDYVKNYIIPDRTW